MEGGDATLEPAVGCRRRLEDAAPLVGRFERAFPMIATREWALDARTRRESACERIIRDTLGIFAVFEGCGDLKIRESDLGNYEHFPT